MGLQYLKTHSKTITEVFGCNSNIQIGRLICVFMWCIIQQNQHRKRIKEWIMIGLVIRLCIGWEEKNRIEKEITQTENSNSNSNNDNNNENNNSERESESRNSQELDEKYCS
jgi:hypothetical protein